MRDAAIVRATIRELAPLWLGALGLGLLVALAAIDPRPVYDGEPNTWPLTVLPLAALWGGLTIGGGSRTTLVHLLARPIPRLRILAWRWALLLLGLALVAIPLLAIGLSQHGGGPRLTTIAIAMVLASIFGAQGGALSDRELYSLGGAMMLGSALLVPVELALDARQLTWMRVGEMLGWQWRFALLCACLWLAAPVIWTWTRALPIRGIQASTELVLASLGSSLLLLVAVAWPTIAWVAAPERGQLIALVAFGSDGPIVATGTLGHDGERDVVDGLVRIDADGERHAIWNRRDEAPGMTVWRIAVPEALAPGPLDDTIQIIVVDGPEPDDAHPLKSIELPVDVELERPSEMDPHVFTYGPSAAAQRLFVGGHQIRTKKTGGIPYARIRASEIPVLRHGAHVVGGGRIWAVNESAELWSAPVPWEVIR